MEESDSELEPETVERRRTRARLAKVKRWTGENVPVALVSSVRRSADEPRSPREVVHARSKSVLAPLSTVSSSLEKRNHTLPEEQGFVSPFKTPAVDLAATITTQSVRPLPKRPSEESEGEKEIRRTAKLSKFFGVPATQLPPPLPIADTTIDKHTRALTEPVAEVHVHLSRTRSFSSSSAGHTHTTSMSSSQMARTMTPFSEYSYDSDDSDKAVEVRVRRGKGRTGRTTKKDAVQGRLGEMQSQDFALVMDKLRRMK
ncbi:hypothetical protein DACRYDRAFT_95881 [Dacryopinax primogenitus]|uniref:Uncharacterized protein n=1 Tax=Dacryopinax primogenitus (strain DJM 731) TaxID=1858805 RepID=M5FTN6_DACPD|nr:uncharacterized protein DACRYDRAFT_95881 [Dacryopinax primogenitus]EJT99468.1 hypothetical protein DACRYDRAFT_95881 [Dacryopinax primogenitus]